MREQFSLHNVERHAHFDINDEVMAVGLFTHDPVRYLTLVRDEFLARVDDVAALDIDDPLDNPVVEAQVRVEECLHFIGTNDIAISHPPLQTLLAEYEDEGGQLVGETFFTWLRDAGYPLAEVAAWVDYDSPDLDPQTRFKIRQTLTRLSRVYGQSPSDAHE